MSILSNLSGQSKKVKIGNIELDIKARTLADVELFVDMGTDDKKGKAMKELVRRTLKDAVPDATDEEIDKIGLEHFKPISEAIVEINGLKPENAAA
jgi:hypothetical protein